MVYLGHNLTLILDKLATVHLGVKATAPTISHGWVDRSCIADGNISGLDLLGGDLPHARTSITRSCWDFISAPALLFGKYRLSHGTNGFSKVSCGTHFFLRQSPQVRIEERLTQKFFPRCAPSISRCPSIST